MHLTSFRIKNFRSIVDTDWISLSPDNVTVLVGQNESGKSSILDALSLALTNENITADDIRSDSPTPEVEIKLAVETNVLRKKLSKFIPESLKPVETHLKANGNLINLIFRWEIQSDGTFAIDYDLSDKELKIAIEEEQNRYTPLEESNENAETEEKKSSPLSPEELAHTLNLSAPYSTSFSAFEELLPSEIDINEKNELAGNGENAANNFLEIANIDIKKLINSDIRTRQTLLFKASTEITKDFCTFWSQLIGQKNSLKLECTYGNYGSENPSKLGKPHLTFWIYDGINRLYPRQRSLGVRWFLSFYLQIRATEKKKQHRIFLLDEPGANLHSRAQKDVIKLINQLSDKVPIIYSTHSKRPAAPH